MHAPDALRRYYQQFLAASPEEIEVSLHIPSKEADNFIYQSRFGIYLEVKVLISNICSSLNFVIYCI